jgi:hypothetical protein
MYYNQQPGYNQGPVYNQGGFNQPPGFYQPAPPAPIIIETGTRQEPTIINMTQLGKISKCELCRKETDNVMRNKVGPITIAWCCFLGAISGCTLFWIPCCVDSCKDTEVVCQGCGLVKTKV